MAGPGTGLRRGILTAILPKSVSVAFVSPCTCVPIVLEIYGVMTRMVQYNVFVATGLIAGTRAMKKTTK